MKKITTLCFLLLFSACDAASPPAEAPLTPATMEAPKLPTLEDSLPDSAKKAEEQGDFKQAALYYQQLLNKSPKDENLTVALADALRRDGQWDKALELYERVILLDPNMIAAKEGKALALIAKGDYETPGPLLADVMKADPTRWKTLNALGILFSTRNLQSEAQQYFNEALKFKADSASIYNNLGLSQALTHDYDASILSLQRASTLAGMGTPQRKHVDLNLALVYASAGKLDNARAVASLYLTSPALEDNVALYARLAKDDSLARDYLNKALMEGKPYTIKPVENTQDAPATTVKTKTTMQIPPDLFPSSPATE